MKFFWSADQHGTLQPRRHGMAGGPGAISVSVISDRIYLLAIIAVMTIVGCN